MRSMCCIPGRKPVINIVDVLKPADEVGSQRKFLNFCPFSDYLLLHCTSLRVWE